MIDEYTRECLAIRAERRIRAIDVIATLADLMVTRGILKKCVNSQAVYPLSEQHGLEARERRYTAHEEGKH